MTIEYLAFRTIRALCLTAEAAAYAVTNFPNEFYSRFDKRLPSYASDCAEHIAQYVIERAERGDNATPSEVFILEGMVRDVDWLKGVDRDALHDLTHLAVPCASDLDVLDVDLKGALSRIAAGEPA